MRCLLSAFVFLLFGLQSCEVDPVSTGVEPDIFMIVEEMPFFPGGDIKLMEFIAENIQYPQAARDEEIEGRVIIKFIVNLDGHLSDIQVLRGIGGGCGEEAIRVMEQSPNWIPGRQRGKVVKVQFTMPVRFQLED